MSDTERPDDYGLTYTDDELLDALQTVDEQTNTVTIDSYREHAGSEMPGTSVIIDRFGSWIDTKKEAGVGGDARSDNARPREYTTEDMIEMLRECRDRYGKVSQSLFDTDDDFCASRTIVKRFGSWAEAKSTAGVE